MKVILLMVCIMVMENIIMLTVEECMKENLEIIIQMEEVYKSGQMDQDMKDSLRPERWREVVLNSMLTEIDILEISKMMCLMELASGIMQMNK